MKPKISVMCVLFLICLCTSSVYGQMAPPLKDPVIWDTTSIILPMQELTPDGSRRNNVVIEGSYGNNVRTISLPQNAFKRDYFNGTLYAFGVTRERDTKTNEIKGSTDFLWRHENGEWVIDAVLHSTGEIKRSVLENILPLQNGKYIVCAYRAQIIRDDKAYLFGIYKKNKKLELELENPVEDAFSVPTWTKEGPNGEWWPKIGPYFGDTIATTTGRVGSKIIFHIQAHGIFFIFDGENGKLLRRCAVYPEINEKAFAEKKWFDNVSLGMEATKDGKILCVTVSKDFAVHGKELFPPVLHDELGIKEEDWDKPQNLHKIRTLNREREDKKIKKWPNYVYWELDVDTGKFTKVSAPENLPEKVRNDHPSSFGIGFYWRTRADGTYVLTDQRGNIIEEKPGRGKRILDLFEFKK
ncbi:MAG: hypothetical protein FWG02_03385 [Holophagaceae bacterium]|nr:hypothetical protein [Holophagaceae bacterium]